jgi:hypothetical protein
MANHTPFIADNPMIHNIFCRIVRNCRVGFNNRGFGSDLETVEWDRQS